jgi:hypothetical protein
LNIAYNSYLILSAHLNVHLGGFDRESFDGELSRTAQTRTSELLLTPRVLQLIGTGAKVAEHSIEKIRSLRHEVAKSYRATFTL